MDVDVDLESNVKKEKKSTTHTESSRGERRKSCKKNCSAIKLWDAETNFFSSLIVLMPPFRCGNSFCEIEWEMYGKLPDGKCLKN